MPVVDMATVRSLLDDCLAGGDDAALRHYLASESRLPGPRGNLELAGAFARLEGEAATASAPAAWDLVRHLSSLSAGDAPTNTPDEFIPFCGAWAAGEVGAAAPDLRDEALVLLHGLARDTRWRMREAVANGIQSLIRADSSRTLAALDAWIVAGEWLAMRAVAAGLAEPSLLITPAPAEAALAMHRRILDEVRAATERRSEEYRVLRQGLEYTLSVVVQALPERGFAVLGELVSWGDADVTRIVRENLKKGRLLRPYPDRVAAVTALLP